MGGTLSRSPVPCDGSDVIGRCDSFLHDRNRRDVQRVAGVGFERADAALAQDHVVVAARHDVFGGEQQLFDAWPRCRA